MARPPRGLSGTRRIPSYASPEKVHGPVTSSGLARRGGTPSQVLHCDILLVLPPDKTTVENASSKTRVSTQFPLQELGFSSLRVSLKFYVPLRMPPFVVFSSTLEFVSKLTNVVCGRNVINRGYRFPAYAGTVPS